MPDLTKPTGSMVNNIYANSYYRKPEVGMGATELMWTDRHACTIIRVINDKTIEVQHDRAIRTDANGMSDAQTYRYEPNLNAEKTIVTLRRNGRWVKKGDKMHNGTSFAIGTRNEYHDYSF